MQPNDITFYQRFEADILAGRKTITIRDKSESHFKAGDILRVGRFEDNQYFCTIEVLSMSPIMLDNLTEQHAAQENMGLEELKEVIRAIYPSEERFYLIEFKMIYCNQEVNFERWRDRFATAIHPIYKKDELGNYNYELTLTFIEYDGKKYGISAKHGFIGNKQDKFYIPNNDGTFINISLREDDIFLCDNLDLAIIKVDSIRFEDIYFFKFNSDLISDLSDKWIVWEGFPAKYIEKSFKHIHSSKESSLPDKFCETKKNGKFNFARSTSINLDIVKLLEHRIICKRLQNDLRFKNKHPEDFKLDGMSGGPILVYGNMKGMKATLLELPIFIGMGIEYYKKENKQKGYTKGSIVGIYVTEIIKELQKNMTQKFEMADRFNPSAVEQALYQHWEESGYFKPSENENAPSYCIAIPPPNVTGSLHMGHAFQQTLMDTLIRFNRMEGHNTLWQAGTDHAGIATQMVVERKIAAEEGKTRHDYGREAFINKIWDWKAYSGGTISQQMRRLGNSIDWERERFTMDDGLSNAVKEVFVRLHEEGLIYRGKRLVNWDPKLHTAISDLEVENKESKGSLWHFRYPLANGAKTADGKDYLVVATTRPETMLGDTAVAVHPEDERYQSLIGKTVVLPLANREIPIIADEYVDREFGTGVVKITPAHDFNDYEVGKRHSLPMVNVLTLNADICDEAEIIGTDGKPLAGYEAIIPADFRGLERFAARKKIVADFEALGLLDEIKPHDLKVPYGDRGGVPIEPMLTDQWYVSVKPLADVAIKAVEDGEIQFVPKQYENLYFSWMRDIQDWCISRQLWWGHRIPAWYDAEGNVYVARNEEEVRSKYNLDSAVELKQDEDVLDTWFSSGLWTFSTLGWPEQTKELKMFHPTDVLITGFDIIFFWVARMIMFTMHFVKDENGKPQVPFKTVYVTGLIRDEQGQKMSKSKGNVLDPIDMIDGISLDDLLEKRTGNMMQPQLAEKIAKATRKEFAEGIAAHGTDALRFTLAALASNGRDINWDMKRLEGYRNFCNKLWNASRFVLTNEKLDLSEGEIEFSLADRWIQSEFNRTVETFRNSLSQYRFDLCANAIYEFTWNQFCDWYLELTKPVFANGNAAQIRAASQTLIHVLEKLLRLAHPLIPFITEEIWQKVKGFVGITADSIMLQPFPQVEENGFDPEAEAEIEWLKEVIVAVRNIRAESNIAPSKGLDLLFRNLSAENAKILEKQTALLKAMAKLDNVQVLAANETAPLAVAKLVGNAELLVPMAGFINKEAELTRLTKEIEKYQNEVKRIENKLSNEAFVAKAPEAVIAKEREKQAEYQSGLEKIQEQYKAIEAL